MSANPEAAMHFLNHYSGIVVAAMFLALGISVVVRRGKRSRDFIIVGGALLLFVTTWLALRPVPK